VVRVPGGEPGEWVVRVLAYEFRLDAHCVMPDHYHVVLNVGHKKTISQILHAVESYVVTEIGKILGLVTKPKIWEGRPWDEVIRTKEMY
jgi:REP element-mobilizing transposase RayT